MQRSNVGRSTKLASVVSGGRSCNVLSAVRRRVGRRPEFAREVQGGAVVGCWMALNVLEYCCLSSCSSAPGAVSIWPATDLMQRSEVDLLVSARTFLLNSFCCVVRSVCMRLRCALPSEAVCARIVADARLLAAKRLRVRRVTQAGCGEA